MIGFNRTSRRVLASTLGAALLAGGLVACSSDTETEDVESEQFGYLLSRPIVTMNAGTGIGVATDAEKVSARLYPGAFLAGPDGQLLPNPDLVTATPQRGNETIVDYEINAEATYSDGAPVVCDDFLLTQTASSRPDLFGADMPLFSQVAGIDCAPGAKNFRVNFNEGFGARYRELFTPGTVLPSHVVAERAGVANAVEAIQNLDENGLAALGTAWQDVFNVEKTDPAGVPTHGPYKVASRGEKGQLTLAANPNYAGDKPLQPEVVLWPNTADVREIVDKSSLAVADLNASGNPEELGITEPDFMLDEHQSGRVDTLRLDTNGIFSQPDMRKAFNACIDREAIVAKLERELDTQITPTGLRMLPTTHPLAQQLERTSRWNMRVDKAMAGQWLTGMTVRIGYLEAVPRYRMLVDGIKDSCAEAGVTIEPVPLSAENYGVLGADYDVLLDTRPSFGRNSQTNANGLSSVGAVRKVELELQANMMTISLTTEPRLTAVEAHVANVSDNTGDAGLSWNMDRWKEMPKPVNTPTETTPPPGNNPDAV